MALKPLFPNQNPVGIWDGYDSQYLVLKGGEVVTFSTVSVSGTDKGAADAFQDGYSNPSGVEKRVVITNTLTSGKRPLMLCDDGISYYGTTYGSILGGVAGQVVSGVAIGPSTATGSGKLTCWAANRRLICCFS